MQRLRILYHHRTQGRGAEGNHIVSIVTALREAGHEVDVVSPPGVDPFDTAVTVPVDASKQPARGWSRLWRAISLHAPGFVFELAECAYNVPAYFALRRALRAKRYDVLFERYASYLVAGVLAARAAGCRFVLEVNDVSGVAFRVRPQHMPRLCERVERWLLARCDLTHAVSSYLGDRLVERGVHPDREEMRAHFGLADALVVGFAGWFVAWDRLDFMLDVFGQVRDRHPNLKLCLVGDGPPARELVERTRGTPLEGAIVLTGAVPRANVYDHIQMFDIGFLPHSNLFGSPVVMFEMMGLRVPLLMPALPPILDVHREGDTALLFPPLDAACAVAMLTELVESSELREALAERAYLKLNAAHTWLHTANRIMSAMEPAGMAATGAAVPRSGGIGS
jgi:glycosyltransferase involved in cell wall biosynthesis